VSVKNYAYNVKSKKVKSNYFIVRLKVDPRAGLPHLEFLPFTHANVLFNLN